MASPNHRTGDRANLVEHMRMRTKVTSDFSGIPYVLLRAVWCVGSRLGIHTCMHGRANLRIENKFNMLRVN